MASSRYIVSLVSFIAIGAVALFLEGCGGSDDLVGGDDDNSTIGDSPIGETNVQLRVKSFSKYPGYQGNLSVEGTLNITSVKGTETTAKQKLIWSLTGMDTACVANLSNQVKNGCGIHIHAGTSCDKADGHYYSDNLTADPWAQILYVATAEGHSAPTTEVEVITGLSDTDIKGRVIVVHALEAGARIACGVID